jgi:hypothetical protein
MYPESMPYDWSAEPLNLLSPEIVTRVSAALDVGIICGVQAFYCGGHGPEPCAFADLNSYISAVENSRPGDWFTLWSVPMLADQGLLLIWKHQAKVTLDELQKAEGWLAAKPQREFLAVGYPEKGIAPEARWGDHDWFDKLQDLALRCAPAGEFAALPLTDLLEENERGRWIPKLHLVDGKRPNERGEVPLGGAY